MHGEPLTEFLARRLDLAGDSLAPTLRRTAAGCRAVGLWWRSLVLALVLRSLLVGFVIVTLFVVGAVRGEPMLFLPLGTEDAALGAAGEPMEERRLDG